MVTTLKAPTASLPSLTIFPPAPMSDRDQPPDKPTTTAHGLARGGAQIAPAPEFTRDIDAPLAAEFRRLAMLNGWKKKGKPYKEERRKVFRDWAMEDFERIFGRNNNSLESWQRLCRLLGIGEAITLGTVIECRRVSAAFDFRVANVRDEESEGCNSYVVRRADYHFVVQVLNDVYVNIIDLIDACKTPGEKPTIFASSKELARYMRRTGKIFPREKAKFSPLLSKFLISLADGGGGGGSGSAGRRRRRKAKKAEAEAKAKAKSDAEAKTAEEAKAKPTVNATAAVTKPDGKGKVRLPLSLQIHICTVSDN